MDPLLCHQGKVLDQQLAQMGGDSGRPASRGCGGATRLHLCRCARRCGGHGAPAVPPCLQVPIVSTLACSVQLA
jgi:hypothetical protein